MSDFVDNAFIGLVALGAGWLICDTMNGNIEHYHESNYAKRIAPVTPEDDLARRLLELRMHQASQQATHQHPVKTQESCRHA